MEVKPDIEYVTRNGSRVVLEVWCDQYASVIDVCGCKRVYLNDGTHGSEYVENKPELDIVGIWSEPSTPDANQYVTILEAILGDAGVEIARKIDKALNDAS